MPFRGGSVGFIVFSLLVPTEPVPPGQTASLMREPVLLQGPLRLEGPHLDSMWITGTGPFIASFFCCYLKTGWLWCVRACNPALNWEAKAGIGVQDQPSLHSQPSHPVSRKQSRNSLFTAHAEDSTIFKSRFPHFLAPPTPQLFTEVRMFLLRIGIPPNKCYFQRRCSGILQIRSIEDQRLLQSVSGLLSLLKYKLNAV